MSDFDATATTTDVTSPLETCPDCGDDTILRYDNAQSLIGFGFCEGCYQSWGCGDTRNMGDEMGKTTIYWGIDRSAPSTRYFYCTLYSDGTEDRGPVNGLAGAGITDILAGDAASAESLADLRNAFGPDVTLDGVGEIFPGE